MCDVRPAGSHVASFLGAASSAEEHLAYTEGATGSNPVPPTQLPSLTLKCLHERVTFSHDGARSLGALILGATHAPAVSPARHFSFGGVERTGT